VKLLIQYLYEAEYEPTLADSRKAFVPTIPAATTPVVRVNKQWGYHYKFPHSCNNACSISGVCHHHQCGRNGCDTDCVDFVCKICCPEWNLPAPPAPPAPAENVELLLHAEMYEVADKYEVNGLKELAREKFAWACGVYWNSKHFALAAHHAYSTTPAEDKGLREVVCKTLFEHMELLDKPEVEEVLSEFNDLAVGLLKMHAKR
jgi:hypothetical protein